MQSNKIHQTEIYPSTWNPKIDPAKSVLWEPYFSGCVLSAFPCIQPNSRPSRERLLVSWAHGKLNHRGQPFNSLSIFDKNYQKNLHPGSKSPIFNSKIYKRLGNGMIFDQSGSTIPLIYFPKRPLRATPGPKQPTDHRQRPQAQTVHHISLDLALRRGFCRQENLQSAQIRHQKDPCFL